MATQDTSVSHDARVSIPHRYLIQPSARLNPPASCILLQNSADSCCILLNAAACCWHLQAFYVHVADRSRYDLDLHALTWFFTAFCRRSRGKLSVLAPKVMLIEATCSCVEIKREQKLATCLRRDDFRRRLDCSRTSFFELLTIRLE